MNFAAFIERLRALPRVVIQTHNFPDHDAVASAFALAYLLETQRIPVVLVYDGIIDRISLQNMILWLDIPLRHQSEVHLTPDDHIVIVDGCTGEKNVSDITGKEVAVIDHHLVTPVGDLWFVDVRPDLGATVTLIYDYYRQMQIPLPTAVATAMQVGQAIDTARLTRGISDLDIEAFTVFRRYSDKTLVDRILKNSLKASELEYYRHLLDGYQIRSRIAFAWIHGNCPKNMLGILGDFMQEVDEVDVTILAAPANDVIYLSLRSERDDIDVARLVSDVLVKKGVGFGGGHRHMAGGMIHLDRVHAEFSPEVLFEWFHAEVGGEPEIADRAGNSLSL